MPKRSDPSAEIKRQKARAILQDRVAAASQGQRRPQATMTLDDFVRVEWRPNAELALRKSSVRYYDFQLEKHIFPALGSSSLCDLSRAQIEACLSNLRQKGYAGRHASRRPRNALDGASGRRRARLPGKESGARYPHSGNGCQAPASVLFTCSSTPAPSRNWRSRAARSCCSQYSRECESARSWLFDGNAWTCCAARSKLPRHFRTAQFGSPKTRSSNRVIPMSSSPSRVCSKPIAPAALRNCAGRSSVSVRRRARHSTRKTSTTARSHPHVIGSNSREYRGIRFGTHMRRCSRSRGITQDRAGRFWAIRILRQLSTPTLHVIPDSQRRLWSRSPEFCSQMFSSWKWYAKKARVN